MGTNRRCDPERTMGNDTINANIPGRRQVITATINAYINMDKRALGALAYHMETTLRAIQLRKVQDPAILAGAVVAEAIKARGAI